MACAASRRVNFRRFFVLTGLPALAARRALEAAVEGAAGGSGGQSGASMAGGSMGKTPEEEAEEEFGECPMTGERRRR